MQQVFTTSKCFLNSATLLYIDGIQHHLDNLTESFDKLVLVFLDPGPNPGGPQSWSLEEGQTNVFLHTLPQLQPPEGLLP